MILWEVKKTVWYYKVTFRQSCQNLLKKAQNYTKNIKNARKVHLKLPYFHGWFKKNRTITCRYYTVILGENLNLTQKISNLPPKYENFEIMSKPPCSHGCFLGNIKKNEQLYELNNQNIWFDFFFITIILWNWPKYQYIFEIYDILVIIIMWF